MKLYISADFEGVCGIVDRHQCFPGSPEFEWARRLWIKEINAIIEGGLDAGATEFVVNEAHAAMNYMLPELLHPSASFITGYVKVDNQMEGFDETFTGAVLMGHSMAGTAGGVLNHGYVMRDVVEVRLNGEAIGELGLNAYWASYLGAPLIMVAGDDKTAAEAKALIPEIEAAVVKQGLSQFAAHHRPVPEALATLRETAARAARRAAAGEIPPLALPAQFTLELDFTLSEIAHLCSFIPGVERVDGRTVRFTSADYRQIQHIRILCTNLTLAVVRGHF
jgi:D-amino peptidase